MTFRAAAFPHSGVLVSLGGAFAVLPGYWVVILPSGFVISGGLN